jgi:hypothetical protein
LLKVPGESTATLRDPAPFGREHHVNRIADGVHRRSKSRHSPVADKRVG